MFQNSKKEENILAQPMFSDADYDVDMRVDPLTTGQRILEEYDELKARKEERDRKAADEAAEEAEKAKKAEIEAAAKKHADEHFAKISAG